MIKINQAWARFCAHADMLAFYSPLDTHSHKTVSGASMRQLSALQSFTMSCSRHNAEPLFAKMAGARYRLAA